MLVIHQTKSGKVRRVPCPPELVKGRVGLLCPFRSNSSFQRTVKRLSGVTRFQAHQLRHTMGCRWLEAGGSLAALQEILGHSTIVVTQRYARLGEAHVRAEVERVRSREQVGNALAVPIRKSLENKARL
jgi:integrase